MLNLEFGEETMLTNPTSTTLKRYGLSLDDWLRMAATQNFACFVCKKTPTSGRLCVDHEHVKGWKKMPPEVRAKYVRGLLCWTCNHYYLGRGITQEKAQQVVEYLKAYNGRRP